MNEIFGFSTWGKNSGDNAEERPKLNGPLPAKNDAANDNAASQAESGETPTTAGHSTAAPIQNQGPSATEQSKSADRRRRRRAMISAPIRVRSVDVTQSGPDETSTTLDVSRNGVLFASSIDAFAAGMEVAVTFPYTKAPLTPQAEQPGCIVRVSRMADGRRSIAIALGVGVGEDIVDAAGRTLVSKNPLAPCDPQEAEPEKPLVLVVDSDPLVRQSLKSALSCEGYKVIAVSSGADGREVLKMFTPALLIAEIEGEDLPGYDLCAHCKTTPRLRTIPVMLLTSSAYPSDYANAHSLGAVVCMAKPYRQERLAHVVRLLAPTERAKAQSASTHQADPSRRPWLPKKSAAAAASQSTYPPRRWRL